MENSKVRYYLVITAYVQLDMNPLATAGVFRRLARRFRRVRRLYAVLELTSKKCPDNISGQNHFCLDIQNSDQTHTKAGNTSIIYKLGYNIIMYDLHATINNEDRIQ